MPFMWRTAGIQLFLLSVEEICDKLAFGIPINHMEQLRQQFKALQHFI